MLELEYLELGERLRDFFATAQREIVIVAPFVKSEALQRLLSKLKAGTGVTLVTRWRADEIALGVTDVGAFDVVAGHGGRTFLVNRLHAKYFRSDLKVRMGSANVTGTALGWSPAANLELLRETPVDPSSESFERALFDEATEVDRELADRFREIERAVRPTEPQARGTEIGQAADDQVDLLRLLPHDPRDLWLAYSAETDLLSGSQADRLERLLAYLGIPSGLASESALVSAAGLSLWLDPIIVDFRRWLDVDRRFGEVVDFVQQRSECTRQEAIYDAQTLIRVLLHFLPTRFEQDRPRHSEIIRRR